MRRFLPRSRVVIEAETPLASTPNAALRARVACLALLATLLTAGTAVGFSGNAQAARAYDEGLRALLMQDSDTAMAAFQRATDADPDLSVAQRELGMLLAARSRWREAEARFEAAARPDFAEAHFRLGEVRLKGPATAIEALERATAIDPRHAPARRILGIAYGRVGRDEDAAAALQAAIAIDPRDVDARHELGSALLRLRSLDEAVEQLRNVVELDPLHAPARLALGNALIRLGQTERGHEMLAAHHRLMAQVEEIGRIDRSLERDARDPESWYRMGRVRMDRREWAEAARALTRCVALAPDDARGYEALGYVYGQLNAHEQALAVYAELMRRRPGIAAYHNGLGVLLLRMRRVEEAIAQFREAIALDGGQPGYHLNLAAAYRQGGDERRAGKAYAVYQAMKAAPE